jgi:hypothetical protein
MDGFQLVKEGQHIGHQARTGAEWIGMLQRSQAV